MTGNLHTTLATGLFAATLTTATVLFASHAEVRPSTKSFTCQGVQTYVQRRGAVVMNTKSPRIYKRFVANRSFCSHSEITETRTVPTKSGGCYLRICWEPLSKGGRFRRGG